jgi:murein DD-endopeptidase MepM/ murein hydrolase activator NlpD
MPTNSAFDRSLAGAIELPREPIGTDSGIDARPIVELGSDEPHSPPLSCGLANPMPGGVMAGYAGDTGLDIAGTPRSVYAIASGMIEYAEGGHTLWNGQNDSPYALRIRLDTPIAFGERTITHVWYAHLSALVREIHEGSGELVHVAAGARLGTSGTANGLAHLHLGMLLDGEVEQTWGTFLVEDDVRSVLCRWPATTRLPDLPHSG